jgi:hypothetical protein
VFGTVAANSWMHDDVSHALEHKFSLFNRGSKQSLTLNVSLTKTKEVKAQELYPKVNFKNQNFLFKSETM